MADYKIDRQPYKPRVYRVKSAPFENPFMAKTQRLYKHDFSTRLNIAIAKESPAPPVQSVQANPMKAQARPAYSSPEKAQSYWGPDRAQNPPHFVLHV